MTKSFPGIYEWKCMPWKHQYTDWVFSSSADHTMDLTRACKRCQWHWVKKTNICWDEMRERKISIAEGFNRLTHKGFWSMEKSKFKELKQAEWNKDHAYTGRCDTCGKDLMKRDSDYSLHQFQDIYCAKHAPLKTVWGKDFIARK